MQHTPLETGLEREREITWGAKMRAYREMAGLQLMDVAALITEAWPTSAMTLSRFEDRDSPPTQRRTRIVAILALAVYGVHPESMGMSFDELPAFIDDKALARAIKAARKGRKWDTNSGWTSQSRLVASLIRASQSTNVA